MRYLDTSVLVTAITDEDRTVPVARWLSQASNGDLAISEWVITEFSAALSIKVRTGRHTIGERDRFRAAFARLVDRSLVTLDVPTVRFREAATLTDDDRSGLRAGDALHLAVVIAADATLCTLDVRLSSAALGLGVAVEDPSST